MSLHGIESTCRDGAFPGESILIETPMMAYTCESPRGIVQEVGGWIEVEPDMTLQFAVLGSGSRGNSTLICHDGGTGLLIDIGLGPRVLDQRLASVRSDWSRITAVVLTHTHGDHVDPATLQVMVRRAIVLYCHEGHRESLEIDRGFRSSTGSGWSAITTAGPSWPPAGSGSSQLPCDTTVRRSVFGSSRSPGDARGPSAWATWPTPGAGRRAWPIAWPTWTSWASSSITTWTCRRRRAVRRP